MACEGVRHEDRSGPELVCGPETPGPHSHCMLPGQGLPVTEALKGFRVELH